eukprot:gene1083-5657_t
MSCRVHRYAPSPRHVLNDTSPSERLIDKKLAGPSLTAQPPGKKK